METRVSWKAFLESARQSAKEVEVLTSRIGNGGRDWSAGGVRTRSSAARSPTESAAIMEMVVVPRLVAQREEHEEVVGKALAALSAVREWLGPLEADILEMFYIDGFLTWEIAGELGMTVDSVFYRKRRAIKWMDDNLPMVK